MGVTPPFGAYEARFLLTLFSGVLFIVLPFIPAYTLNKYVRIYDA